MSRANQKDRDDALKERNEQRKWLEEQLALPDRGGLSAERAEALGKLFKRISSSRVPNTVVGLETDVMRRRVGMAHMVLSKMKWEKEMEEKAEKDAAEREITKSHGGAEEDDKDNAELDATLPGLITGMQRRLPPQDDGSGLKEELEGKSASLPIIETHFYGPLKLQNDPSYVHTNVPTS